MNEIFKVCDQVTWSVYFVYKKIFHWYRNTFASHCMLVDYTFESSTMTRGKSKRCRGGGGDSNYAKLRARSNRSHNAETLWHIVLIMRKPICIAICIDITNQLVVDPAIPGTLNVSRWFVRRGLWFAFRWSFPRYHSFFCFPVFLSDRAFIFYYVQTRTFILLFY